MLWTNSRIHTNSKSCFYWNRQQLPYIVYQTVSVRFASFSPKFLHYWQIIFLLIRLADKQICYKDQTQHTFIDICTQCGKCGNITPCQIEMQMNKGIIPLNPSSSRTTVQFSGVSVRLKNLHLKQERRHKIRKNEKQEMTIGERETGKKAICNQQKEVQYIPLTSKWNFSPICTWGSGLDVL